MLSTYYVPGDGVFCEQETIPWEIYSLSKCFGFEDIALFAQSFMFIMHSQKDQEYYVDFLL